jgi:two-component system LytT family response regulator
MPTALIADDEELARRLVKEYLAAHADIHIVAECENGLQAVNEIERLNPDLVFLDIQMPALNGMDVVATIGAERMPATVFVTAFEQYAVRAFEANAVDYLVKPFSRERFADTLRRVKARLSNGEGVGGAASVRILQALDALRQRDDYIQRIPVRTDEHISFIDVDDIVWIKASGNTVQIHLANGVHEMRETMSAIAARLDPRHFARVHRSAIINVRRIQAIHPWFNGHHVVTMDTGQKLRMSRYQHETFLRLVSARGGKPAE